MSEWSIILYARENGRESVYKEIESFGQRDFVKVFKSIDLLRNYGKNLSQDRIKHVKGKLWELRIDRVRVFYFPYGNRQFIMLRAFMKKTERTPEREIKLAMRRLADYVSRSRGD